MKPETVVRQLLERNNSWRVGDEVAKTHPKHAKGQSPDTLFIACADSRVTPAIITDSKQGELFEHRNVANLVVPDDASVKATVRYAVTHLKVKDVIVCGHAGCGGVKAAMDLVDAKPELETELTAHLAPIVALYRRNHAWLSKLNEKDRYTALIKLNALQQAVNLASMDSVIEAKKSASAPNIHAVLLDIETGKLAILKPDYPKIIALKILRLDEYSHKMIAQEILRLEHYSHSYNPLKWINAYYKKQLIEDALAGLDSSDQTITQALNKSDSKLYQALNYKRLGNFTFWQSAKGIEVKEEARAALNAKVPPLCKMDSL